jgi:periplasmic copper chaperone A
MRSVLLFALLALPAVAVADSAGIQVQNAWSRAMPAGGSGVVYLTIIDTGAPDTLTGASSPVAAKAELHESIDDNGIMKMRAVSGLPVTTSAPVTLKPNGYHIMLLDLKQPLVAGTRIPVTLTFEKAGSITTMATVEQVGASMPGKANDGMNMHGMSMGGMPMGGMPKQ